MWQSLVAINQRTSEIKHWKKNKNKKRQQQNINMSDTPIIVYQQLAGWADQQMSELIVVWKKRFVIYSWS